jgi:hypothetical protein
MSDVVPANIKGQPGEKWQKSSYTSTQKASRIVQSVNGKSHLAHAKWITKNGFRHLVRGGAPH